MIVIRQQRKSRLSAMIDSSGGVSVGKAMAQATANLEAMKPRGMEIIAAQVKQLGAMPAPTGADENAKARAYSLSASVLDAAGPFQMNDLCSVASGLCDLLDASPEGEEFDWRIVTVHVQSMQLMQTLPAGEAGDASRQSVLNALRDVLRVKLRVIR